MNSITPADTLRLEANSKLDPKRKSELGQYMTPDRIAVFMASLFDPCESPATLLDAGAGVGSLTVAAIDKLEVATAEAWEVDPIMLEYLHTNLAARSVPFTVHSEDFIENAVNMLQFQSGTRFTHAILNPPYKKIGTKSRARTLLKQVGIETVNLYTGFLGLAILLMREQGQIVVIIPRSFCNGPYYRPFRELMLRECSLDHIHVFESRKKAFKDDEVLQENVILKLTRSKKQGNVVVSFSHDAQFSDYQSREVEFSGIVKSGDKERFIHIPTKHTEIDSQLFACSLASIGLEVCTGPVVDFRLRDHALAMPEEASVPLIYTHHFGKEGFRYPKEHKKPNALRRSPEVDKWLMPSGWYVLVKRFSAKEERRRVVAYLFDPGKCAAPLIGFENHWNVFHVKKAGLDPEVARGLACFLNTTVLDEHFRVFSGHTQVNATDLRNMDYPSLDFLRRIGKHYREGMSQDEIDEIVSGG